MFRVDHYLFSKRKRSCMKGLVVSSENLYFSYFEMHVPVIHPVHPIDNFTIIYSHKPMSETSLPISVPFLVRLALVFICRRVCLVHHSQIYFFFVANATLFYFFISQFCIETSTFNIQ